MMTKTGQALIDEVNNYVLAPGAVAFWWLGQLGYVVKVGGLLLYLDAFLMPRANRNVAPLLAPAEVTNADWVFGTHDHIDHIDPVAFPGIAAASPQARFVCPHAVVQRVHDLGIDGSRIIAMDEGTLYADPEQHIRIEAVAAAHEFLDYDSQMGYPYLSYIIQIGSVTILHTGDTTVYEGYLTKLKRWKFDLVFLPINGRDAVRLRNNTIGNMTYQEAVDLVGALKPRLAVPGHYEMFSHNGENPQLFADYMDVKYPGQRYWIGEHGQAVVLEPRDPETER
ncbi:MAG: MBL fold metallo-hydrolase [Chloroflexi bacterium]|nr:MBL fold metallo-hydrolase [Chloroflexota bacterium]